MLLFGLFFWVCSIWAAEPQQVRFLSHPNRTYNFTESGLFSGDRSFSVGVVEAKIRQIEDVSLDPLGQTSLPFVFFSTEHLLYVLTPDQAYPIAHFPQGVRELSVFSGSSEFSRSVNVKSGEQKELFVIRIKDQHLSVFSTDPVLRPYRLNLSAATTLPGIEALLLKAIIETWSEKNPEIEELGYGWFDKSELSEALGFIRLQVARLGVAPEVVARLIATHSTFKPGKPMTSVQLNLSQSLCGLVVDENH